MAANSTTTLGTGRAVTAPSRRQIVGGTVLAALTGAAFGGAVVLPDLRAAAESPDAELIRLCDECDVLQAKVDALWAGDPTRDMTASQARAFERTRDAAQEPFLDAQDLLLERICMLRATTRQGQISRARTLLAWDKDPAWTQGGGWSDHLLGAIVRDLMAEA